MCESYIDEYFHDDHRCKIEYCPYHYKDRCCQDCIDGIHCILRCPYATKYDCIEKETVDRD